MNALNSTGPMRPNSGLGGWIAGGLANVGWAKKILLLTGFFVLLAIGASTVAGFAVHYINVGAQQAVSTARVRLNGATNARLAWSGWTARSIG